MDNITNIVFEPGQQCKTDHIGIWQWSYGQILRIKGLELPKEVEIHFSLNETKGEAKRYIGITSEGVTEVSIPSFILEGNNATRDYYGYAFVYLADEEKGETIRKIALRIKSRPKPEDYISPSDEPPKTWIELEKRIEAIEKQGVNDKVIEKAVEDYLKESGAGIQVDEELSEKSTNPVQNKVVTNKFKDVETTVGNIDALLTTI